MRIVTLLIASVVIASPVFAQQSERRTDPHYSPITPPPGRGVSAQPLSNAGGVQIQGNTDIKAKQTNVTAVATGQGNTAKNTAGAIKGGTQIQGNTKIKASQKNATAVASGKGNTAANEAGVIGGK